MDEYFDDCIYEEIEEDIEDIEDNDDNEKLNSEDDDEENEENYDSFDEEVNNEPVTDDKYIGLPYLTKYEKARILGVRTNQISMGSKIFVETNEKDPFKIAKLELQNKKMPLLIRRYFGNIYKDISVNSLNDINNDT